MSSNTGLSRKRTRVDDNDDRDQDGAAESASSGVLRDKDVWLSDGNIVIVAANMVAFRVHRSILSLRSEIFRDLFSLPNGDVATVETMDGCPVVPVSDSPDDIRRLFLVLCCGKNYYYDGDVLTAVPIEVLASLIRMGHKYGLQDILDHALSRLKKYYPTNLAEWRDPDSRARYVTTSDEDAPAVIALARLTNTPSLLPTAFLVCIKIVTRYRTRSDGSVEPMIAALPVLDQLQLFSSKVSLGKAHTPRLLHQLAYVAGEDCSSTTSCKVVREAQLDALRDMSCGLMYSEDNVLKPIAKMFWGNEGWWRLCAGCRKTLEKIDEIDVQALWAVLPMFFALELDNESWPHHELVLPE